MYVESDFGVRWLTWARHCSAQWYIVQVGCCWLQMRIWSGSGRNTWSASIIHNGRSSIEEAESGNKWDDSPITEGELTKVVKKLFGVQARGMDEVHPEFEKLWILKGCPEWHASATVHRNLGQCEPVLVIPTFMKADQRVCSNNMNIRLLSLPVNVKVLERRVHSLVQPRIWEEQYGFPPGHGRKDQLFIVSKIWKVHGSLLN